MSSDRHARLGELFLAAQRLDPDERTEFLERECPDDPSLSAEVLEMLSVDDESPETLQIRAEDLVPGALLQEQSLPESIGDYEVLGQIGEGGMGVVYEARQKSPERRVAVKLLRWTGDTSSLRRFQYEAEALGSLHHPGIAQIHESSTAFVHGHELPFFAMELVEGEPLDRHVARERPDQRGLLELVADICDAVEHAHRRGVIHRDLKPGNVMVTPEGRPKVLDFGIARAREREDDGSLLSTRTGQVLGTVAYMSPEQAAGDPRRIDWRVDVHALGVMLYELLADELPYDLRGLPLFRQLLVLSDGEPIPILRRRPGLDHELAAIVGKAIEKEPALRYSCAADLAADLRRYLRDEPVSARPPTAWYLARKFVRRNRALTVGVLVAVVGLLVGSGAAVVWALRAERSAADARAAEGKAEQEARQARAAELRTSEEARINTEVLAFVERLFGAAMPSVADGEELSVRRVVDLGVSDIERAFPGNRRIGARLEAFFGGVLASLGDMSRARSLLSGALPDLEQQHGPDDPRVLDARVQLAMAAARLGDLDTAAETYRAVLASPGASAPEAVGAVARSHMGLGLLARDAEDHDHAEMRFRSAIELLESLPGVEQQLAQAWNALGSVMTLTGRLDESLEANLAAREAAGPHAPRLLLARIETSLGMLHTRRRELSESRDAFERSLAHYEAVLDPDHPGLVQALVNLSAVYGMGGDIPAAEECLERVVAISNVNPGVAPATRARALQNLGNCLLDRGDAQGAMARWEESLGIWSELAGPDSEAAASLYATMAEGLEAQGKGDEAAAMRARADRIRAGRTR